MKNTEYEPNANNWKGLLYFNKKDSRVVVPKRVPGMGWTLNFANPYTYIMILAIISIIVISNYLL